MRKFKIDKNDILADCEIYSKYTFTFEEGITVLVGCNGAGKTTLMNIMMKELKKLDIPYTKYYGLEADSKLSWAAQNNSQLMMKYMSSKWMSEGEQVSQRFSLLVQNLGYFVLTECKDKEEAWVFIDSLDSGLSIDNVIEVRKFFDECMVIDVPEGLHLYIVIAANSYEFAKEHDCIDVQTATHKTFKSYNTYAKFIMKTRDRKDKWQSY